MPSSVIKSVTFDCDDALVVAMFWAAALGTDLDEESTTERAVVEAAGWGGPNMWFVRVPEPKTATHRMHVREACARMQNHCDLRAPDGDIGAAVARLAALDATLVRVGDDLTVMQDPGGNEFCVE